MGVARSGSPQTGRRGVPSSRELGGGAQRLREVPHDLPDERRADVDPGTLLQLLRVAHEGLGLTLRVRDERQADHVGRDLPEVATAGARRETAELDVADRAELAQGDLRHADLLGTHGQGVAAALAAVAVIAHGDGVEERAGRVARVAADAADAHPPAPADGHVVVGLGDLAEDRVAQLAATHGDRHAVLPVREADERPVGDPQADARGEVALAHVDGPELLARGVHEDRRLPAIGRTSLHGRRGEPRVAALPVEGLGQGRDGLHEALLGPARQEVLEVPHAELHRHDPVALGPDAVEVDEALVLEAGDRGRDVRLVRRHGRAVRQDLGFAVGRPDQVDAEDGEPEGVRPQAGDTLDRGPAPNHTVFHDEDPLIP